MEVLQRSYPHRHAFGPSNLVVATAAEGLTATTLPDEKKADPGVPKVGLLYLAPCGPIKRPV